MFAYPPPPPCLCLYGFVLRDGLMRSGKIAAHVPKIRYVLVLFLNMEKNTRIRNKYYNELLPIQSIASLYLRELRAIVAPKGVEHNLLFFCSSHLLTLIVTGVWISST